MRRLVGVSEQSWGEGTGPARLARLTAAFTRLLDLGEQGSGMPQGVDGSLVAEMLVSIYVGQVHNWRISDGYPLEERLSAAGRFIAAAVECATEPDSRVAADPDK